MLFCLPLRLLFEMVTFSFFCVHLHVHSAHAMVPESVFSFPRVGSGSSGLASSVEHVPCPKLMSPFSFRKSKTEYDLLTVFWVWTRKVALRFYWCLSGPQSEWHTQPMVVLSIFSTMYLCLPHLYSACLGPLGSSLSFIIHFPALSLSKLMHTHMGKKHSKLAIHSSVFAEVLMPFHQYLWVCWLHMKAILAQKICSAPCKNERTI